jgi:hypothetical protein
LKQKFSFLFYQVHLLDSKIGVGIILGYKYLDGSIKDYKGGTTSVEKNSAEIGIRINW